MKYYSYLLKQTITIKTGHPIFDLQENCVNEVLLLAFKADYHYKTGRPVFAMQEICNV